MLPLPSHLPVQRFGSKRALLLAHWRQAPVGAGGGPRRLRTRARRARYEQLVTEAMAQGELRAGTDARALARMIEVTLGGSFLAWTLHREGDAATRLREDLDATLRPYLVEK